LSAGRTHSSPREAKLRLRNRVAIVTGAGRGIGQAVAIAFAQQGACVVVNDYGVGVDGKSPTSAPAEDTAARIRAAGGRAIAHAGSVSDAADVARMVELCLAEFGRVDILVNNAGIIIRSLIVDTPEEDWDRQVAVHMRGSFLCAKAVVPAMMRQSHGRIVNLTSSSGLLGMPGSNAYTAAKAGVIGLTRLLAQELSFYNITANAVAPGANTRMGLPHPPAVDRVRRALGLTREAMRGGVAVERDPQAVAAGIVYLASEEASYINGQVIGISGNRLDLWSFPQIVASEINDSPWTVDSIFARFQPTIGAGLSNDVLPLPP
jgi:NAD(P)-dependent dehydrogenase (short-subunit alcohol dehydrogenase family)